MSDMDIDTSVKKHSKGKANVDSTEQKDDILPWVEKYRPNSMDDLVSHDQIVSTINRFIKEKSLPHLLFYGPPGTGKTSLILAIAKTLYGPTYKSMILELNASDDRGIDAVRNKIKVFASTQKIFSSGFKLIILDEADSMTPAAQNALRRVIEKYTKNVRFCIICNYVNKIISPIQSRCTRFRFQALGDEQIKKRLDYIVEKENVKISSDGRKALIKLSEGDLRKTLNILQSAKAAYDYIDEDTLYKCTGAPIPQDIKTILDHLMKSDYSIAHSSISSIMKNKSISLMDIVVEILKILNDYDMPANTKAYLFDTMADFEYRLAKGCSESIQLSGLVGTFKVGCEIAKKASKK